MSLQYIKSQKGKDQLLYKGYLHKKERTTGNKTLWKCADYHKYHCTGRAQTCDDQVVKYLPHLHPPSKPAVETRGGVHSVKETGSSSQELTHKVVTTNCDALPGAVADRKSRIQNAKQTIQRLRACLKAARPVTCNLQTSATVAKTGSEGPPLSRSLVSPNLHKCSDAFTATPILCNKTNVSDSTLIKADQEAGRQRFRLGTIQPGEAPQEILSQLSEAAQQWLRPHEHSKDQIVDMVILEQFLNVLPVDMRMWVRAREPDSSKKAAQLAEACFRELQPAKTIQDPIAFEDVSVHFTEEEWALLSSGEKDFYWNIMHQNYENVAWLAGDGKDGKNEEETHCQEAPEAELRLDTWCMCVDCEKHNELPALISSQKSPDVADPEPMVLSGELSERSEKRTTQNPQQSLIKEVQSSVERQHSSHLGKGKKKTIIFRNCLRDLVHQATRPGQEAESVCPDNRDQNGSLTLVHNQDVYSGEDSECMQVSEERIFQSPQQGSQPSPTDIVPEFSPSELNETAALIRENQNILESQQTNTSGNQVEEEQGISMKEQKGDVLHLDAEPGPNCEGQDESSRCISSPKSILGAGSSSSSPQGLKYGLRSSSPSLLDKIATEPSVAQLMAVLQQVAVDTAAIKSAVSSLHITITGIQNSLGNISGCTDEAEHRISDLEDTSRNTKAQLVQHCNDIKAIEAKLIGKTVQTDIIAGLWSSMRVKREASSLNLSSNK